MTRSSSSLILCLGLVTSPVRAQLPWLQSYYLNVGLWSDATLLSPRGVADLQRLRFMVGPSVGPVSTEAAYEHVFSYRSRPGSGLGAGLLAGVAPGGGEWIDLGWTIAADDHVQWQHRFDRLNVRLDAGQLAVSVGRQTISWATTLLLTPADPFLPFDPADPFREYRAGVDAVRARAFPGPLSELEFVLRPADTPVGNTVTVAARGHAVAAGWEYSGWAGVLHDRFAVGLGASRGIGRVAVRLEAELRDGDGDFVARGTAGVDTRFDLFDRDLYVIFEYQHDGFGASSPADFTDVMKSPAFIRGELQTLGADVIAAQAAFQLHPLVSTDLLVLANLRDPSALIAPGISYSLSDEMAARAGMFVGAGSGTGTLERPLPSEFGLTATVVYASLTAFF